MICKSYLRLEIIINFYQQQGLLKRQYDADFLGKPLEATENYHNSIVSENTVDKL